MLGTGQLMSSASCSPDTQQRVLASISVPSKQRIFVPRALRVLSVPFGKRQAGCHRPSTPPARHSGIKPMVESFFDRSLISRLLKLCQSERWVLTLKDFRTCPFSFSVFVRQAKAKGEKIQDAVWRNASWLMEDRSCC